MRKKALEVLAVVHLAVLRPHILQEHIPQQEMGVTET